MTVDEYLALIPSWHASRPRFRATVEALITGMVAIAAQIAHLPEDFDLDTAIGVQLDVVGQWVGRSRFVDIPLPDLYFSFDDPPRGFDLGIWKGPYDSLTGITRLDDDTYRLLLRAKIAANTWDGTVEGAQAAFNTIFVDDETLIFIDDHGDMSATYGVSQKVPTLLVLALLSQGYLPLKSAGVRTLYRVVSANNTPLFGFDVQNDYVSGFDTGSFGVPPEHFINYPPL